MKRLLIDLNSSVFRRGRKYLSGIGRTTLELVQELAKKHTLPFQIYGYIQKIYGYDDIIEKLPIRFLKVPLNGHRLAKELIALLQVKEIITKYDILHIPHNYEWVMHPKRTIITLHDAMFFSYPEEFLGHQFARKHYPKLAKDCRAIVTCSNSSKADIAYYMNINIEKISVIPWGISKETFFLESDAVISQGLINLKIMRPYFLMVSCDEGRKNTISLLRAYKLFIEKKREHDLVLVWPNPPFKIIEEFNEDIIGGRIHFLDSIDDDTLRILYNGATCSFFPSRYEGFGLPVLESMACGTPVVTCKNSSLYEIGGEMAYYTSPDSLDELSDYMIRFEEGKIRKQEDTQNLIRHSAKYNWTNVADSYIDFYLRNGLS